MSIQIAQCKFGLFCVLSVFSCCLQANASDLYFSAQEDANKYWDYAAGWKALSGTPGVLPTADDTITLNSKFLSTVDGGQPLTITNGVDAICTTLRIASSEAGSGSSYFDDGRIIGVRLAGGTLRADLLSNDSPLVVGDNAAGYGYLRLDGGCLNAYRIAVGGSGIGVVTNAGGEIKLDCGWWSPYLYVGEKAGSKGELTMTSGLVRGADNNANNAARVQVGYHGTGVFNLSGGTVSNVVVVGGASGGHGTMNWTGGSVTRSIYVGQTQGSTGVVYNAAGELKASAYVGENGLGEMTMTNGARYGNASVFVGHQAGSLGRLYLNKLNGSYNPSSGSTLYAGFLGAAEVEVSGEHGFGYVKISATNTVRSTVCVKSNGLLRVGSSLSVGGSAISANLFGGESTDPSVHCGGNGELKLEGGTVRFIDGSASTVNFYVGRYAAERPGTFGVLRGYGKIDPSEPGETNIRMAIGDGQIIADGGTLDLNSVVSVTNLVSYGANTTNGWYAVNGGSVLYPRAWFAAASEVTRCCGTLSRGERPDLVNTVRFTIRGATAGASFVRGGVWAADSSNIKADELPGGRDHVVGVWRLGDFTSLADFGKREFTSIDVAFHYDAAKVPAGSGLQLYRWNATAQEWESLETTVSTESRTVSVTGLDPADDNSSYNIGTFALVERGNKGFVILFR